MTSIQPNVPINKQTTIQSKQPETKPKKNLQLVQG